MFVDDVVVVVVVEPPGSIQDLLLSLFRVYSWQYLWDPLGSWRLNLSLSHKVKCSVVSGSLELLKMGCFCICFEQ